MFLIVPAACYRLNAHFQHHAEHKYMAFVAAPPRAGDQAVGLPRGSRYGRFASVAELVRQIGCDERQHKDESLARMAEPRLR